jgi:hypothetical protein
MLMMGIGKGQKPISSRVRVYRDDTPLVDINKFMKHGPDWDTTDSWVTPDAQRRKS